jgi:hypothetical protein
MWLIIAIDGCVTSASQVTSERQRTVTNEDGTTMTIEDGTAD